MRLLHTFVFSPLFSALVFSSVLIESADSDSLRETFFEAAKKGTGELETVKNLLNERSSECNDQTSLEIAKFLIASGGRLGDSNLINFAKEGHLQTVKCLLNAGLFVFTDHQLNAAIWDSRTDEISQEIAKYLIAKHGTINDLTMPYAAYNGHLGTLQYLLETRPGGFSDERLNFAMIKSRTDETSMKVAKSINQKRGIVDGQTLIDVAKKGHLGTIKYLLQEFTDKFSDEQLNFAISEALNDETSLAVAKSITQRKGIVGHETLINVVSKGHLDTLRCLLFEGSIEFSNDDLEFLSDFAKNQETKKIILERKNLGE